MKNILRLFILATLIFMVSQVTEASNGKDKIETSKIIDGKTNAGGFSKVKAFSLSGDYQWKNIENDIRMNVQFGKSINIANNRIVESFLNKI